MFQFCIGMVASRSQARKHGPLGALTPEFAGLLDVICREVRIDERQSAMIVDAMNVLVVQ
jgi:hypothetical protein